MEWRSVVSSHLGRVRYDEETMTLEVEFQGGDQYQYFDVPKGVYQGLMAANSKGGYFHREIKGNFRYAKK